MKIEFRSSKLAKQCSSAKAMRRSWGENMARKLQARLAELEAAASLDDISKVPPAKCHELSGDRAGQLSVDLVQPFRLLFVPKHDPLPTKPDGGLDRSGVTEIVIVDIADTH